MIEWEKVTRCEAVLESAGNTAKNKNKKDGWSDLRDIFGGYA